MTGTPSREKPNALTVLKELVRKFPPNVDLISPVLVRLKFPTF
jgi:hypothetical protein